MGLGICSAFRKVKTLASNDIGSFYCSESTKGRITDAKLTKRRTSTKTISFGTCKSEVIFYDTDEEILFSDSARSRRRGITSFDGLNKRCLNRNEIGLDILKAQLQLGADPKKMHTHGDRTCLMFAVLAEDFSFIKELVQNGVDVNQTNSDGETALGFAIELGREDIANFLRMKGAQ